MGLALMAFFLIRFGLLAWTDKGALQRAAVFAPRKAHENTAYVFYQLSTAAILILLLIQRIRRTPGWLFGIGLIFTIAGLILLGWSEIDFARPQSSGFCRKGLYRISRNPMYGAYFIFFLGCVLMSQSTFLGLWVCIFQISAHWIILSEERWCLHEFKQDYQDYMASVRRYL